MTRRVLRPLFTCALASVLFPLVSAAQPGAIKGTVTATANGLPLAGITIVALDVAGQEFYGITNASGVYAIPDLPAGTYLVFTDDADGQDYVNEAFNNLTCPIRCTFETNIGTPVSVTAGADTTGIDFSLATGAHITGTVTDATSGLPVAGVQVVVVSATLSAAATAVPATTNASGVFTVNGLPPGTHYALTSNSLGYINQYYGGIPCTGACSSTAALIGAGIVVPAAGTASGVNFALAPGGRISGRVTDAVTTANLESVLVFILDSQNRTVAVAFSDSSGIYMTGAGLPAGSYYAVAAGTRGYAPKIYDNISCLVECLSGKAVTAGTPIPVTAGATSANRNFALQPGGRIRGVVTDATSALPIRSVFMRIFDALGREVTIGSTDQQGMFTSDIGLPTGAYYLFTLNFARYVNEIYDNKPCADSCLSQVASGTAINVTEGVITAGINVALAPSGLPAAPFNVHAVGSGGGVLIGWAAGAAATSYRLEAGFTPGSTMVTIPVSGTSYLASGVPPGRYYVRVRGLNGAGAGPASDELILTVGAGSTVAPQAPGVLSATMVGNRVILTWSGPEGGAVPTDYVVEAGSASGLANIATIAVSQLAFTYDPVPAGFYFVRVRSRNAGGMSDPSDEVMVVAGGAPSPPLTPARLASVVAGSSVTLSWFAPAGAVTGYVIEAGSAPGLSNLAIAPVGPMTSVNFGGVPPGKYYVRIRAVNALGRSVASDDIVVVVG